MDKLKRPQNSYFDIFKAFDNMNDNKYHLNDIAFLFYFTVYTAQYLNPLVHGRFSRPIIH